jgi:hypothetical protein
MLDKILRGYNHIVNIATVLLLLPLILITSIGLGIYWVGYFPIWRWNRNRRRKHKLMEK